MATLHSNGPSPGTVPTLFHTYAASARVERYPRRMRTRTLSRTMSLKRSPARLNDANK